MKKIIALLSLLLMARPAFAEKAVLISANATSTASGSASALCVVNPKCKDAWISGARDSGLDEGLYYQFSEPLQMGAIEVHSDREVRISVNGHPLSFPYHPSEGVHQFFIGAQSEDARVTPIEVRSVFIRIAKVDKKGKKPTISAVRFYSPFETAGEIKTSPEAKQIQLVLPTLIETKVTASSILNPSTAYQPANLFDSKFDFAWATNGKTTSGKNETLNLQFTVPQTITGFMIWNGYQRSANHYIANGRVKSLSVMGANKKPQAIELIDKDGRQSVMLSDPIKETKSLELKISDIFAGQKYKDVLLSEIRFIGAKGEILVPETDLVKEAAPAFAQELLDRSYVSQVCGARTGDLRFVDTLKIRSDGTFTVFNDKTVAAIDSSESRVLEGNWSGSAPANKNSLRVFGKRYVRNPNQWAANYGQHEEQSEPEIFQSDLKIRRLQSLTAAEKKKMIAALLEPRLLEVEGVYQVQVGTEDLAMKSKDALKKAVLARLEKTNPIVVESTLFSDVFVPSDTNEECVGKH